MLFVPRRPGKRRDGCAAGALRRLRARGHVPLQSCAWRRGAGAQARIVGRKTRNCRETRVHCPTIFPNSSRSARTLVPTRPRTRVSSENGSDMQAKASFATYGRPFQTRKFSMANRGLRFLRGFPRPEAPRCLPGVAKLAFACTQRSFSRRNASSIKRPPAKSHPASLPEQHKRTVPPCSPSVLPPCSLKRTVPPCSPVCWYDRRRGLLPVSGMIIFKNFYIRGLAN